MQTEVRQVTFTARECQLVHKLENALMSTAYLWWKALHVISMVSWFTGLSYLPRLFVHHAEIDDPPGRERFEIMEKRTFVIMTVSAAATVVFGYVLAVLNTDLISATWFRLKMLLVVGLAAFHYRCYSRMVRLRGETGSRDTRWSRWFNAIPGVLLLAIVLLAVAKPF